MAEGVHLDQVRELLVVLATAAVAVPLLQRYRLSPILGYLAVGALLGPHGLGGLARAWPPLAWVTVGSGEGLGGFAEFGVVFLMFVIGLELSLERLSIMRRWVFGLGGAQVAISALVLFSFGRFAGLPTPSATVVALALALSSTAIVVELLAGAKRLASNTGRATFAILLFQDLAVVPILFMVGALSGDQPGGVLGGLAYAVAQAVAVIALIVTLGRLALAPLMRLVAQTHSSELFMAATLLVIIGTAAATQAAGMSMALGAFVAGLLLAETEYRRAVETTIEPFKGLLLGVFFFSVGMSVDLPVIAAHPFMVVGFSAGLLLVKGVVMIAAGRLFRLSWPATIEAAFLIGPGGEFAFIVLGLAITAGIVHPESGSLVLAVVSLTMVLLPFHAALGARLARRFQKARVRDAETLVAPPEDHASRAIVVGYGRVGEVVADMLEVHRQPYLVIERDPTSVTLARRAGKPVFYGDASDLRFLQACGLDESSALIITMSDFAATERVVEVALAARPDEIIVARARDAAHATLLYRKGVTDAVPETIEASLQLSEAALVGLGVAMGPVIASIHEKRDMFRAILRAARQERR